MSTANKAKAAGISASSFFDLRAELSKQEDEFSRKKATGLSTAIVGGVQRPAKKPTVWARQNAGVKSRNARDLELEAISRPTIESARAVLERKAKIYDQLRKGKTGGLSDKQYDALLVDFDQNVGDSYESDSDDVDESLTVPQEPVGSEDDPVVEYEDEFGRIRTARRSEVPRNLAPTAAEEPDEGVIYNPINYFPVYEPSAERVAEIEAAHSEANNPLGVHYDASREVRAKGAAFYQLSTDEETRKKQMEELKSARQETEKTRQEMGAVDIRPGEVEGMRDEGGQAGAKSRAMEKRKRELEERRRMVDAKRKKVKVGEGSASVSGEKGSLQGRDAPTDPFVALESQAGGGSERQRTTIVENSADAFLAQLERDILSGKAS